jgi:glutaminyl-peptide cyclotransferase
MHFVGANDPAASVGTLMEIGRVLGSMKEKPKVTYRLVFFDGEEAFCEKAGRLWQRITLTTRTAAVITSRSCARKTSSNSTRALILLDMMGYKNLELGRDTMSTRWLQDIIWQTGRDLGYRKIFVDRDEGVGGDDHEAFVNLGVPSVDLIQLSSYPYWHKADDTIDKISAQSMKIVGETVLASLPKIAAHDRLKEIKNPQ